MQRHKYRPIGEKIQNLNKCLKEYFNDQHWFLRFIDKIFHKAVFKNAKEIHEVLSSVTGVTYKAVPKNDKEIHEALSSVTDTAVEPSWITDAITSRKLASKSKLGTIVTNLAELEKLRNPAFSK